MDNFRIHEDKLAMTSTLTARQLQRVFDYISAALDNDKALSLDLLAQQIGFSPYHFARTFRLATGASPHQFVVQRRIERAQTLLSTSDLSLAVIALECGFCHHSHFARMFKRHLGCSPREYRRAQHNGAALC